LCQSKKQVGLNLFKVAHFCRDRICFEAENLVCFQGLLAAEEVKSNLLQGGGWNAQSSHDRAAELHNLAAHAHQAAATAHGKGDHLSAHELSRQAEEHSRKAHEESTDVRKTLGQATESKK
jgi:hypothetical protein